MNSKDQTNICFQKCVQVVLSVLCKILYKNTAKLIIAKYCEILTRVCIQTSFSKIKSLKFFDYSPDYKIIHQIFKNQFDKKLFESERFIIIITNSCKLSIFVDFFAQQLIAQILYHWFWFGVQFQTQQSKEHFFLKIKITILIYLNFFCI